VNPQKDACGTRQPISSQRYGKAKKDRTREVTPITGVPRKNEKEHGGVRETVGGQPKMVGSILYHELSEVVEGDREAQKKTTIY